jgi:hypothetical protein|tara:strand:+ start:295 stop:498 length:204 start_codon:yes stop_codon:yes gene_type:complete
MKKVLVTLHLKDKVSLLVDVNADDWKQEAREKALNEFRECFHSEYYKAFLRNHTFDLVEAPVLNLQK